MASAVSKGACFTSKQACRCQLSQPTSSSVPVAAKLFSKSQTQIFAKSLNPSRVLQQGRGRLSIANAGFDEKEFEVLGIPGVEISGPQTQFGDGSIIEGRVDEEGNFVQDEEEDVALELSWDPEDLLGSETDGAEDLIARNMAAREEREEEEKEKKEAEEKKKAREELQAYRDSRVIPQAADHTGMIQYLLDTEINELEFEVTRCRPQLTAEFFEVADQQALDLVEGEKKEQIKEMIRATREFVSFMDGNVAALAAPAERLKDLLTSKNPKEKIADMAGNGEIDEPLLALLFTNMQMAKEAGSTQAAEFMSKLYELCKKFAAPV